MKLYFFAFFAPSHDFHWLVAIFLHHLNEALPYLAAVEWTSNVFLLQVIAFTAF